MRYKNMLNKINDFQFEKLYWKINNRVFLDISERLIISFLSTLYLKKIIGISNTFVYCSK